MGAVVIIDIVVVIIVPRVDYYDEKDVSDVGIIVIRERSALTRPSLVVEDGRRRRRLVVDVVRAGNLVYGSQDKRRDRVGIVVESNNDGRKE